MVLDQSLSGGILARGLRADNVEGEIEFANEFLDRSVLRLDLFLIS